MKNSFDSQILGRHAEWSPGRPEQDTVSAPSLFWHELRQIAAAAFLLRIEHLGIRDDQIFISLPPRADSLSAAGLRGGTIAIVKRATPLAVGPLKLP